MLGRSLRAQSNARPNSGGEGEGGGRLPGRTSESPVDCPVELEGPLGVHWAPQISSSRPQTSIAHAAVAILAMDQATAEELLRTVYVHANPICQWWNTRDGCKKGKKCPLRHLEPWEQRHNARIRLSRYRDHIAARPPLTLAMQAFFNEFGKTITVG